jgi:hypothetical protein
LTSAYSFLNFIFIPGNHDGPKQDIDYTGELNKKQQYILGRRNSNFCEVKEKKKVKVKVEEKNRLEEKIQGFRGLSLTLTSTLT